jgi:hypothetical protein
MHVKSILHEFGTCKIDFTYIRYYLAVKIDFTGFPILAAPDLQKPFEEFKTVNSILLTKYCSHRTEISTKDIVTLTGKGRHVRNTEVDGTARARAAAGRRGLRSSPARAQIVAVRLCRWRRRR